MAPTIPETLLVNLDSKSTLLLGVVNQPDDSGLTSWTNKLKTVFQLECPLKAMAPKIKMRRFSFQ